MKSGGNALAPLLAVCLAALVPARALAHPLVDEGKHRFEQADFDGALESFARAEQVNDLTLADLEELYQRRAIVEQAMHRTADMEADLFRLATLDPHYPLGREATPPVRRAFEAQAGHVTEQIRVNVDVSQVPGGVKLEARVDDDAAGIVAAVRVNARTPGGMWNRSNGAVLTLPSPAGGRVEYYAEAIGPGGATVATAGSQAQPLATGSAIVTPPDDHHDHILPPDDGHGHHEGPHGPTQGAGGGDDTLLIVGVVGAVLAVAAAVVIIAVVATSSSDQTCVCSPFGITM